MIEAADHYKEPQAAASLTLSRRSVLMGAAAAPVAAAVPLAGASPATAAVSSRDRTPHDGTRQLTIYAEELPGQMIGYGLKPGEATVPGPILEMWEGETLEIELVNTTAERLSIHPHGVDYEVTSDGTPLNDSATPPGERRTYVWNSHGPYRRDDDTWAPGTAGYWHYHDHAMGSPHGTIGLRRGLYGALVVRHARDTLPDRQFTCVFNGMSINNRVAPDTPLFEANHGERVEFIAIGHGDNFHTFHLHGHRWVDNRTGMLAGPRDLTPAIDNKNLNPGCSFGFQVIAGESVGPGAWMYHCHVQLHADNGMAGIFLVRNADGSMPEGAQAALDRYHGHG